MDSQLEADRIGRIGERQFETLCERAGLCCNKSAVDVMGWDYIVESLKVPASQPQLPLDQRLNTAARVQVKSTLSLASNRIRLSLSAIDRLAKDPHPALIVVLRLSSDGEPQSGYLVHVIGNELARVLHRLRLAEARKAHDIHHVEISYDFVKTGFRFEPTPTGLLAALNAACGQDPGEYAAEKLRQLAELGYENGKYEAEAIFWVEGLEHFNTLMLGLSPIKPEQLRVFDSRFGIRLPYQGALFADIEEFHLIPPTLGPAEVSIRGPEFGQVARFDAEMFVGPPMPAPYGPEILIRASELNFRLTPNGLTFETAGSIDDLRRTLGEWAELLRALVLISTRQSTLTIAGNEHIPSLTLSVDQPLDGPYLETIPLISKFADGWVSLLAKAGVRSIPKFEFDVFWTANEARMAVDILLNPKPVAYFEFDFEEFESLHSGETSHPPIGLYINSTSFVDASITYSARVFFEMIEGATRRYRSVRFEALDVRPKVDDLDTYGSDQAASHNIKVIIHPSNLTHLPARTEDR